MAEAFLASRHDAPEHQLVVKRIRPDYAENESFLRRFFFEAQVASRVHHRNLVPFVELGRVGDCHYLAMEPVHGHSLHRLLERAFERGEPLPHAAALHLGLGMLDGLAALHRATDDDGHPRPILHRDITPSNVIVDHEGEAVIIDFGIAKDIDGPSLTLPGQVIGTARYMAPEHRKSEWMDARADVFSVSVVLFELLTGRHPWPPLQGMRELLRTSFDPPEIDDEIRALVEPELLEVVMRGLSCHAEDRWADAETMRQALGADPNPELGRAAVRDWVEAQKLPTDAKLTRPVVDLRPPEGEVARVMWSADGSVSDMPSPIPSPDAILARSSVLVVPPLPPRRERVDLAHAEAAALGAPMSRRVQWMLACLIAGLAGAWWLLGSHH